MANYTQAEARKEINAIAKKNGLLFKRQSATIAGKQAYMFTCRTTGKKVIENRTFWGAYEDCMSGYIANLNGQWLSI